MYRRLSSLRGLEPECTQAKPQTGQSAEHNPLMQMVLTLPSL